MTRDPGLVTARRIREAREKAGLSQKALAEKVDVSAAAINQYEHGKKKPSSAVLTRLAVELGVSTDFLLGASNDQDIFVSNNVAAAFRDFKGLGTKDRQTILRHIQFLKSEAK